MRKTSMLAAAAAGVAFSSATVFAANLPVKAPPAPPPPLVVPFTWSGFYFGAHVGYGFGDAETATTHFPSQADFDASPFHHSTRAKGLLGGFQAGYNVQSGEVVYGFEVDWSYSRLNGTSTLGPLAVFSGALDPGSSQFVNADVKWLGTARLRLGSSVADRTLIYATGGAAFGKVEYAVVTDYVGDAFRYPGSLSKTRWGWTAGGGIEVGYAPGWTIKAEYLYFDLKGDSIVSSPVAPNPPFQVATDHALQGHILRLGMNYRFGGRL